MMLTDLDLLLTTVLCPDDDPLTERAKSLRRGIDIRVAGEPPWDLADRARLIRAKVEELTSAGAAVVGEEDFGEQLDHVVMLDPEGNEFCVA